MNYGFGWSGPQLNQTLILIFKSEFYVKQKGKIRHKQTSISIENVFSIFYNFPCHSSLPSGLAFIRFRNVHGPSPQPTALRTPANSLSILIGSNRAQGKLKTYFAKRARLRFIKLRLFEIIYIITWEKICFFIKLNLFLFNPINFVCFKNKPICTI